MPVSDAESTAIYRRMTWRLVPLLLCLVMSSIDRVNIGFAKLQMLGDLTPSETANPARVVNR